MGSVISLQCWGQGQLSQFLQSRRGKPLTPGHSESSPGHSSADGWIEAWVNSTGVQVEVDHLSVETFSLKRHSSFP